jgi:hypothetical protein
LFQHASTRLNALSISEEQSSQITILTDEGDTVKLSTRQHAEADLLTYQHLVGSDGGSVREKIQLADFEMEREVDLAVQGDLSGQEMADIQALLKDLGGMLKAFLTGVDEGDAELGGTGGLDRFESLSAFTADFEYRVSMHYLNFQADQSAIRPAAEPGDLSPADPKAVNPAAAVSSLSAAEAAAVGGQASVAPEAFRADAEQVAAKMAKRVHESGRSGHRRLRRLKKFLKNFLQEMLANQVLDAEQAGRGQSVIEKFMSELKKPADAVEVRMNRVRFNLQVIGRAYEPPPQVSLEPDVVESA